MSGPGIGLGELIVKAAEEIREARNRSSGTEDPVLKFEGCELELKVTMSAEAGAGIKVWLFDASAKGKAEHASTIKLRFGPAGNAPVVFLADGVGGSTGTQSGSSKPKEAARKAKVENLGTPS